MYASLTGLLPCLLAVAAAMPTATTDASASECSQYSVVTAGGYIVNNDLWGESSGSGSGCFSVAGTKGKGIQWEATWNWAGGDTVKGYPNAERIIKPKMLSAVKSMDTHWDWSYSGSNLVGDVSYDLFTSYTDSTTGAYATEIMVWLKAFGGSSPISSSGSPVGHVKFGKDSFKLYSGSNSDSNGSWQVFSFVAEKPIHHYKGDINDFLKYLVKKQGLDASQYLISVGAGTEAVTGSNAKFTVHDYSMEVKA